MNEPIKRRSFILSSSCTLITIIIIIVSFPWIIDLISIFCKVRAFYSLQTDRPWWWSSRGAKWMSTRGAINMNGQEAGRQASCGREQVIQCLYTHPAGNFIILQEGVWPRIDDYYNTRLSPRGMDMECSEASLTSFETRPSTNCHAIHDEESMGSSFIHHWEDCVFFIIHWSISITAH